MSEISYSVSVAKLNEIEPSIKLKMRNKRRLMLALELLPRWITRLQRLLVSVAEVVEVADVVIGNTIGIARRVESVTLVHANPS